jgi:antitoxin component YwqK of YwqJK toxin-antitoxin module
MIKLINLVFGRKANSLKKNGRWKEFNKHGILISVGIYVQGLKHGQWKEYYDTGELMLEENYQLGVMHGQFTTYHPNGSIMSEGLYRNGKREGYFKVYAACGTQTKSLLFKDDALLEEDEVSNVILNEYDASTTHIEKR